MGPNGPDNPLGYPVTDIATFDVEYDTEAGHVVRTWHTCTFEQATIYWPFGGEQAFTSGGQLHEAYQKQFGGPKGKLGIPVGDETPTPTSGGAYQNFEHGVLVWHPPGHRYAGARAFASAQISIAAFMLVDENDGPLGGDLDLFVRAVLERADTPGGTGVNLLNQRFPEHGDYDSGDHTFDTPFTRELAPVLRGEHEFQVMFAGYDADTFGHDDRMGAVNHGLVHPPWDDDPYNWDVQPAYSVDNLWGFEEPDSQHTQHHFKVTYTMHEIGLPLDDKQPFRAQGWWQLHNFHTHTLSLEQYARTFADVDSTELWWGSDPFTIADTGIEGLFYTWPYKKLAKPGNCFGMSLEAIYALKGRSLFREPVHDLGHPLPGSHKPDPEWDLGMINEFNVKHGYQVGQPMVTWFLQLFGLFKTHDPQGTFLMAREMFEDGDDPVLSFTRFVQFKGHTVLPIRFVGGDGTPTPDGHWGEIWVADPYKEWKSSGDSDDHWRVVIDDDNTFSYNGGDWSGGSWAGDRMFAQPWRLLDHVPNTPLSDFFLDGAKAFLCVLGGDDEDSDDVDARVVQVTDGAGRTLFQPGLDHPPSLWSDLRQDPAGRIPDFAPIPTSGEDNDPLERQPQLFFGTGPDSTHTYEVTGTGRRYRWGLRAPAFGAVVASTGGAVPDLVTASRLNTADRSVAFAVPPGGAAKQVTMTLEGMPRSPRGTQFLLDQLTVTPKQRIETRLRNGGRELLVRNTGAETTVRVRLRAALGAPVTGGRTVPLAAGKVSRIRPASWAPGQIGTAPLLVEVRDTVDGPPVRCFEV